MNKLNVWINHYHNRDFNKNQIYFILNGLLSQGYNNMTLGVFLTGYALWLGATDAQAGMITSIIYMASIFQLLIVKWWHGVKKEKPAIIAMMTVARLMLSLMIIIPFMPITNTTINVPLFGIMNQHVFIFYCVIMIGMLFGSSSGVKRNLWMMNHLPRHLRGDFFSTRNRGIMILSMILSLSAGQFLDFMSERSMKYEGFLSLFVIGALFALLDALVLTRIDFEEIDYFIRKKQAKKDSLITPLRDHHFIRVLIYQALFTIGISITAPFFNVYMLQKLKISYVLITGLLVMQVLISAVLIKLWGKFSNRHRWMTVLNVSLILFLLQMIVMLMVRPTSLYLLPVVYVMAGIFGPAYTMAMFNLPYSHLKKEQETTYMSVNKTVVSAAGMVGVMIGGVLMQFSGKMVNMTGHYLEANILISVCVLLLAVFFGEKGVKKIERNE